MRKTFARKPKLMLSRIPRKSKDAFKTSRNFQECPKTALKKKASNNMSTREKQKQKRNITIRPGISKNTQELL